MKMKMKNDLKSNITSISLKILMMVVFITLLFTQYVFAEENYFTIEIPKGYQYAHMDDGDTKLVAAREDGKLNFNIQVYETEEYSDYSQEGLSDLIRIAKKDMDKYEVGSVTGKIATINEYPCYDLSYKLTSTETDKEMYIRQIYVYEDKYSYVLTLGGESEEILKEEEIQESIDTFAIEDYKRENVLEPEKEKMNTVLIVVLIVAGIIILAFIIKIIVKKIINRKNKNKNKKTKEIEVKEVIDLKEE